MRKSHLYVDTPKTIPYNPGTNTVFWLVEHKQKMELIMVQVWGRCSPNTSVALWDYYYTLQ